MITEEEISHQNNNFFDLSHPSGRVGVVQPQPRNLVRASLGLATGCDCSGARSRRSAQQGDKVRLGSFAVADIRGL